jgi:hypothetical protein
MQIYILFFHSRRLLVGPRKYLGYEGPEEVVAQQSRYVIRLESVTSQALRDISHVNSGRGQQNYWKRKNTFVMSVLPKLPGQEYTN